MGLLDPRGASRFTYAWSEGWRRSGIGKRGGGWSLVCSLEVRFYRQRSQRCQTPLKTPVGLPLEQLKPTPLPAPLLSGQGTLYGCFNSGGRSAGNNPGLLGRKPRFRTVSIDLLTHGDHRICVDYLLNFPAMIDDHKVDVDRNRIGWAVDYARSGAIWIYGVGPCARRPI